MVAPLALAARALLRGRWWQVLLRGALLVAVLASAAIAIAWSGVLPLSASSGHAAVTRWLLHSTLRQTVALRSLRTEVPEFDAADARRGAGHYATGCAPCHGAPGQPPAAVVAHMTPSPPYLPPKLDQWRPAELFWIVHNGIKFTAMPAWPAPARDDEVWAMVAFLQQLPELDAAAYRRLAYGDDGRDGEVPAPFAVVPAASLAASCERCHGVDGRGRGSGAVPILAGQSEAYLLASLRAFARGDRASGIMQPIAAQLSDPAMRELAAHFATQPWPRAANRRAQHALGERRSMIDGREHTPTARLPDCRHCHGPDAARDPRYPRIAGQYAAYIALQLTLFRDGRRGADPYARLMHHAADPLEDDDIERLARHFAGLDPAPTDDRSTPADHAAGSRKRTAQGSAH